MANWKDVTGNKFEPTYIDVKYDLALFIDSRYYYELYYEQRLNEKIIWIFYIACHGSYNDF